MDMNQDIMNLNKLKEMARNYSEEEQRAVLEVLDINLVVERIQNDLKRYSELQEKVNSLQVFYN